MPPVKMKVYQKPPEGNSQETQWEETNPEISKKISFFSQVYNCYFIQAAMHTRHGFLFFLAVYLF